MFLSLFIKAYYCETFQEENLYFTTISDNLVSVQGSTNGDSNALVNKNVDEVIIPRYVKNSCYKVVILGQGAFRFNSNIKRVFISRTVEEIQFDALAHMSSLTEVTVEEGSSLVRILRGFLYNTKVESFVIPPSVSYIDIYAFGITNMKSVKYCGIHYFSQSEIFKSDRGALRAPDNVFVSKNYLYQSFGPVSNLQRTDSCPKIYMNGFFLTCNRIVSISTMKKFLIISCVCYWHSS